LYYLVAPELKERTTMKAQTLPCHPRRRRSAEAIFREHWIGPYGPGDLVIHNGQQVATVVMRQGGGAYILKYPDGALRVSIPASQLEPVR
jgi:hypothetical protein